MTELLHNSIINIKLIDKNFLFDVFDCKSAIELHNNIIKASSDWERFRYENIPGPNGVLRTVGADKFKGDLFEIFAEGFYKIVGADPTIAVRNYEPISQIEDYGVDAKGIDNNDNTLTFSIKFRNRFSKKHRFDNTHTLNDIGQFISWSQNGFDVPIKTKNRMILFTTYDSMSPFSNPNMTKYIKVHGWDTIRYHVDGKNGNKAFWTQLKNIL